jgi:glyoxylase-like metal-dependent hydrolase (beta-lactamase superfamily II)
VKILAHTGGIARTNCYLVADETARAAVLFDAPDHTIGPLLDQAVNAGWDVIGLWLTHGHFDHLADHAVYRERFPRGRILMHPLDEPKLRQPGSRIFTLPFTIPPGKPDALVNDGDELAIGSIRVRVLHTPGHAPGHVCYHLVNEKVLIGGDLIIGGAVGRTDLPDSDPAVLAESVRRVMQLPDETSLLGGHGESSTLGQERAGNPYVRAILNGSFRG